MEKKIKPHYSKFRLLYEGISKKRLLISFVSITGYGLIQALNDIFLSELPSAFFNGTISSLLFKYIILLVAWETCEVVYDLTNPKVCAEYEASTCQLYLKVMNDTKPEILKKYNTGYISGLIQKFSDNRENMMNRLLDLPLFLAYLGFIIIRLSQYGIEYAVLVIGLIITSNVARSLFNKLAVNAAIDLANQEGEFVSRFIDTGSNMNTVQKMQSFGFMERRLEEQKQTCMKAVTRSSRIDETGFMLQKTITYTFLPVALLLYLHNPDAITDKLAFAAYLGTIQLRLIHNSRIFADLIKRYAKYSGSFRKLTSILNLDGKRAPLFKDKFESASITDLDYSYEIENKNEENIKVHVQIPEFNLKKGDIVCICGESGQGKTTLLNILSGEITSDSVAINGKITPERLSCVFISQDTEIFDMTLRDNIKMGNPDISDDDIIHMLESVGLDDWFNKQELGLDTRLGERGVFVSTGQRQRLNLIRGLLIKNKEVYMLDEPTSNVDEKTELRMITAIQEQLKGKTIIIVTHRPNIMRICNSFYRFENSILEKLDSPPEDVK